MHNKFNFVKKGYDPAEVDKRIDMLEAEIKGYRDKDLSITNAIMSAQLAADEILRRANVAADTIMLNARNMSARLTEASTGQITAIISSVKEQRRKLLEFKEEYAALLAKYILNMDENDISQAEKKAIELEAYLQKFLDAEASIDAVLGQGD
jgi:cell division septum initiation protein DivIVA